MLNRIPELVLMILWLTFANNVGRVREVHLESFGSDYTSLVVALYAISFFFRIVADQKKKPWLANLGRFFFAAVLIFTYWIARVAT